MRHLFVICLFASSLSAFGFCQTPANQSWFNKKSEEKGEFINQEKEDSRDQALREELNDRQALKEMEEAWRECEAKKEAARKHLEKINKGYPQRWEEHQSWFNKKSEEKGEFINQEKEDSEDRYLPKRLNDKPELEQTIKERENKHRDSLKKWEERKQEEKREFQERQKKFKEMQQEMKKNWEAKREELDKEFEKRKDDFHGRWEANRRQSKEFFEKREKESDQMRERLIKDLERLKQEQERKEVEKLQEVIISHCGAKQQSTELLMFQNQCFNCSSEGLFQDPQVLVFVSFSIPDQAWISLSEELEKVGATFVLRGLPNQSFQALASRILKLKEQGVNAPIQLDPKSFVKFEINQVPAIVVVEEQAFDKVSGHVSIKFALEKMSDCGETKVAKTLYQSLKGRV